MAPRDIRSTLHLENTGLQFTAHCKSIEYKITSVFKEQKGNKNVLFYDSLIFLFH